MVILSLMREPEVEVVLDILLISALMDEVNDSFIDKSNKTIRQILANRVYKGEGGVVTNRLMLMLFTKAEEYKIYSNHDIVETFLQYHSKPDGVISQELLNALEVYRKYLINKQEVAWEDRLKSLVTPGTVLIS